MADVNKTINYTDFFAEMETQILFKGLMTGPGMDKIIQTVSKFYQMGELMD
jgi:hypothetical protein